MVCLDGDTGLEIWSYLAGGGIAATPGLADITGDGVPDVCFGALDNKVYLVNGATGGIIWTYSLAPGLNNIDCSPVMVDVDGDDVPDAIIGGLSHPGDGTGVMIALNGASSGPYADEIWTQEDIWGNARRPAAPAKLNDDDVYDFIVTSYATETYSIYALDGTSGEIMYKKLAPGVPSGDTFNYSAPIVGDFTGDGHLNALYGRQDGFVDFVNIGDFDLPGDFTGRNLFSLQGSTSQEPEIFATPAVDDVDGDGELELVLCNMRGYTYVIDLHAPVPTDPALRGWMQHQGNRWHTGVPEFTPPDE
jgi:outer membrane protein assembly factor BamB